MQEQLGMVAGEVAQGRRSNLDMHLSVMSSELRKSEDALTQYKTWSTCPAAIALRMKIDDLQHARISLVALKRGKVRSQLSCVCGICLHIRLSACLLPMLITYPSHPSVALCVVFFACYLFPHSMASDPLRTNNSPFIWTSPLSGVTLILSYTAYHMHT